MDLHVYSDNRLVFNNKAYRVALGRGGIQATKAEGDGATPTGTFPLRQGFYRADRVEKPLSDILFLAIQPDDGWCDDPAIENNYNRLIKHPFPGSAEYLWRDDHRYDLILVPGHNDSPPIPGLGSAIFIHIAREDYGATEGCIALCQTDLSEIISIITLDSRLIVHGEASPAKSG